MGSDIAAAPANEPAAVRGRLNRSIDPPKPPDAVLASAGAATCAGIGCARATGRRIACSAARRTRQGRSLTAFLYSDLLLHDMGADLADGLEQGAADGSEFRTAPLWRASDRQHFLHDGRASTIEYAVRAHGGQGSIF